MKILKRKEVPESLKWDLTRLYDNDREFLNSLKKTSEKIDKFYKNYKGKLKSEAYLLEALEAYEKILEEISSLTNYSELKLSVDMTDEDALKISGKYENFASSYLYKLNFFESEIIDLDEKVIKNLIEKNITYKRYLEKLLEKKAYTLSLDEEELISKLKISLDGPYGTYEVCKLSDMDFDDFEVDGKTYKNSYGNYENLYCYSKNTEIRRKSYNSFYNELKKHKNTTASVYINHVKTEKQLASIRGYDSVFDYLLFDQEVTKEMYFKQINLFMDEFSQVIRKYLATVKKYYKLDKMTFADIKLKIEKDNKFTIENAEKEICDALKIMGEDYLERAKSAFTDRWVDYANNFGKSTGGFCASPYRKGSYILMTFAEVLSSGFTLSHEIGHGVHFSFAQEFNKILEEPSLYMIEAPSTMNELIFANSMIEKAKTKEEKLFIYSALVGDTYFHNCVTHLLEAAFQREIYLILDRGEDLTENILEEKFGQILERFFGDSIEIDNCAKLTWMRQPHYYMGLYSYVYSASLSIATQVFLKIKEDRTYAKKWIKVLKSGGSKTLRETLAIVGINIDDTSFIENAISYVDELVKEMEGLSQ